MAHTVTQITAPSKKNVEVVSATGLISGTSIIYGVPENCVGVIVETYPTSAGTATLKASLNPTDPTDFTNFGSTSVGAMTAITMQELPGGLKWLGLDVASGTWVMRVKFQVNHEVL